jgi:class 3 adenylate cyclase
MSDFESITAVTECSLLVAFTDLTGFARMARQVSPRDLWATLSEHYIMVGDLVPQAGGKVVKFMGDGSLLVFPEDKVDVGVRCLKQFKAETDKWFEEKGLACRLKVAAHFGPLLCGPIGTRQEQRFDVSGLTVMTAATLGSYSFAITPQVFRKLTPETRKLFKKHTPPIRYIPVESKHVDG